MNKRPLNESISYINTYLPEIDTSNLVNENFANYVAARVTVNIISEGRGLYPIKGEQGKEIYTNSVHQAKRLFESLKDEDKDKDALDNANNVAMLYARPVFDIIAENEIVPENNINEDQPVKKRGRKINCESMINRARLLYKSAVDKTSKAVINRFVKELKIAEKTATTYYYLVRNESKG